MPAARRILSIWFPHLGAELVLRKERGAIGGPLVIVEQRQNALCISSLCAEATAEGLSVGQSLSDARVLCLNLRSQPQDVQAEKQFLQKLKRWASQYSPWVATHPPEALMLDISGCAHLFGGEEALADRIEQDCERLRLTVRIGIADTVGAAWALARFSGSKATSTRSGDAIDQEARATRSRAFKRKNWERGGTLPLKSQTRDAPSIAPPGQTLETIEKLPIVALRLDHDTCIKLTRLGIKTVEGLASLPRSSVARRFGADTLRRLDQALGAEPEPVSPSRAETHFATRMSFPDPIGLPDDIEAGISRLLLPLCEKLRLAARGARKLQLTLMRTDQTTQIVELGLAKASHDTERILPLLSLHLPKIEPKFGIDLMRLEALVTEPITEKQHQGPITNAHEQKTDRSDLLSRLGTRLGLESLTILQPADSHIPEKTAQHHTAAYAHPVPSWPRSDKARPITIFDPEPVTAKDGARPPSKFRWRRKNYETATMAGPERIAPEWWLDDPNWRTGTRDYWQIVTSTGERLWLFQALGGHVNGGWFCQGDFE